ncbi:MAG: bifunctional riboflavin kinase/FAD synthetase [Thermoguttaceae bacterium]
MQLFRNLDEVPERFRHGAVTIGNFDGVHRGHARIIERLAAMARRVEGPAVVFTFDPHPARLLRPDLAPQPLSWTERKVELLEAAGAEAVVAYPTDREFLRLDAKPFFDRVVRDRLDARGMVEGANFFFGHDRSGDVGTLEHFCADTGRMFEVVEPVEIDGAVVSSSRLRSLIASGQVELARTMLTEPYRIRGQVVRGAGRGAGLGFPTANVDRIDTLLPGEGIYAGRVWLEGSAWPAAIAIGPNPTFGEGTLKVEAFLIGFEGTLYDRTIEVDFLARLRKIERFESAEQLVAQMDRDVAATRSIVEGNNVE